MQDNLLELQNNGDVQDKQIYKIYSIGIFAAIASALLVVLMLVGGGVIIFIPFLSALVFDIYGLIMLSKLKVMHCDFTKENKFKLSIAKFLIWFTFIGLISIFLTASAFLVYIGIYGFGR